MNIRAIFVGALLVAGAIPLAAQVVPLRAIAHPAPTERVATPEWPTHFRDRPLTQLPLGALEERFAQRFPGAIGRFTDGQRVLVIRYVTQPTRQLHPAEDCFRALGYRLARPQPMVDASGDQWRCFVAERAGNRVRVCERIHDDGDGRWTDASAWFWSAQYGDGPWWAITVVSPLGDGT